MSSTIVSRPSRRLFLRASGAALALPQLAPPRAGAATAPKRFVVYHVPEGVPNNDASSVNRTPDYFWPRADLGSFPKASAPMAKHRDRLLFVRGIRFAKDGADRHTQGMEDMLSGDLTGAPSRTVNGLTIPPGTTLDQILGLHLGRGTPFRVYGLGVLNHLLAYRKQARISFSGGAGRDPVNNPLKAFDDLLASAGNPGGADLAEAKRRLAVRKSVLDGVRQDAQKLRCDFGADGRAKLDAYLTAVREIEQRISQAAAHAGSGAPRPPRPEKEGLQAYWGAKANAPALGELQMRTAAAALAADTTRVIFFQWNHSLNGQTYPWLPVSDKGMSGHGYAHATATKSDPARWAADRATIFEWYARQFVRFLDLLASTPDGTGTLLDSTTVLYCSEMEHGHHGGSNLPFVLAGGGRFRAGRVLDAAAGNGGRLRSVNDLMVAIAQGFGLEMSQMGRPEHNGRAVAEILA